MRFRNALNPCTTALALFLIAAALPAAAQTVASQQTLDRVFSYDTGHVLNMAFGNAIRPPDFTDTQIAGANFISCTLSAGRGLFCLDGRYVRNWPNPAQYAQSSNVLDCADPALGFETRKGDPCTSMTVDQTGTIWLAAKKRNAHSVIKVIAKTGASCPDSTWAQLGGSGGTLCAKELYSGRPVLVDLIAIDGDVAKNFIACPTCVQSGVIGIEERRNAVFFPDSLTAQPVILVASKAWGLAGSELLQDISVVQLPGTTYPVETTLLATTTSGRILAKNINQSQAVRPVFNIPAERLAGSTTCNALEQQYGMRASPTTGFIYVSDRNYCQVLALKPDANSSSFVSLVNYPVGGPDLTLSTVANPAPPPGFPAYYGVVGLTVAPGISIDLTTCAGTCTIVNGQGGTQAAKLSNLQLAANSATGATVFQVKGIPDCRYATFLNADKKAVCSATSGVVIDPTGAAVVVNPSGTLASIYPASAMRLNVTPLLPADVTNAFNASGLRAGGLPPLLVSRQYRAQAATNYIFEALFVLPQSGVRYVNTFEGEFNVGQLEGDNTSLGCTKPTTNPSAWDIATYVSELFATEAPGKYVDTLANIDCGSIKIGADRMSLLPYDLQVNPDTWAATFPANVVKNTTANDAVFARLMQTLYSELDHVQTNFACTNVDAGSGAAPIASNTCSALSSTWANGKQKLDKCIEAAFQPKSSASNENCQSFVSQLTNYRNSLPASTATQDVANRVGELKVRIAVIFHVYYDRFLPSIPAAGFCRETTCAL